MKQCIKTLLSSMLLLTSSSLFAWSQPTHKRIVEDALDYMNSPRATMEQQRAHDFYVAAAGSHEQASEILGQAAFDVDDFQDTRLGEWFRAYERAPLGGLASSIVQYTSYWHFINMTRGEDEHGNDHGGYDYRYHTKDPRAWADIDAFAKTYLYNLQLHKNDFATTEAHYRQGSDSSLKKHYEDFQEISWQPIDNLGKYWYEQFIANPSMELLGYSLHVSGDVAQPHHVWVTSANSHASWEGWVENYYDKENLGDPDAVETALQNYNTDHDVRAIWTYTAEQAYAHPEVLYDNAYDTRKNAAKKLIPHAIANVITILTKAANTFY